ncbi:MAG: MCP four helix bundle domain-containing protein [Lachnospiraceae bacterium]|nr:MCP four helix bundle domain-containing protein [Lachnospiraceae bacterium]
MSKSKKKGNLLNFKGMRIEERLRKAFNIIISIASIASTIGIICLLVVVANFKSAMNNYALPQGDIALFMNEYAECRSNTRGIIGYEDQKQIDLMVEKHDTRVKNTMARFEAIHSSIVTPEGEAAYEKIKNALDAYFVKEAEIIKIGATTDQEQCRIAQNMAINDLTPLYNELDTATLELMNINIEKEHRMETVCAILEWGSIILMVVLVLTSAIISKRIAHIISKGISNPLAKLEDRFESFAEGDIKSEFPTSNSQDEIAGLMNSSHDMAERLKMIILDVERMCAEMSNGNFNVESDCADAYVGDLTELYVSIKNMNINVSNALKEVESVSNQVNDGAINLAEAASNLAEGATDQAASIEEMLATMNTVSDGLKFTAQSVDEAYNQLKGCATDAQASHTEMGNMVESMNRISETSKKIENIIAEIESIASQTNLLSLNASIEAARAGDAGRGFAVVADEIRDLADQSAKSAIDTRELVNNTLREIEEGSLVANRTADVLYGVVDSIQKIAVSAKTLSENTQVQAEAVEQADQGIARISEVVQSNSAAAEESYATSEELSAQAATMHNLVAQFQLKQ